MAIPIRGRATVNVDIMIGIGDIKIGPDVNHLSSVDLSSGEITVSAGTVIVVTTTITNRASDGRICNNGIFPPQMTQGEVFIDGDGLWKLRWNPYSIQGLNQTLVVDDPLDPSDIAIITVNVI